MIHGRTTPAIQTLTHTPCTQLLPRHGTPAMTVIPCKTHSMHTESAPWSTGYHPFGEGHGHTNTVFGPVQGSEHGMQYLANQELQMQTLHPIQGCEARPHHQARTQRTKADIQSRPMCTTLLAPRLHPMGGSYAQTTQKGHGREKELNYSQDAHTEADTRPTTTEQAQGGLLAEGCGRMAEFLAQAPWSEKREGLSATQSEIE